MAISFLLFDDLDEDLIQGRDGDFKFIDPHALIDQAFEDLIGSIRRLNGFLRRSSTLNDVEQDHDDGKHQQQVNEPSHRVTAYQPKKPKNC